jgi:hypothetical protein
MIPRYQRFIQRLNNIQKVCILTNMLMDGLSVVRAPAATLALRRDVAQAFHRVLGTEAFTVETSVLDSGSDYSVD